MLEHVPVTSVIRIQNGGRAWADVMGEGGPKAERLGKMFRHGALSLRRWALRK